MTTETVDKIAHQCLNSELKPLSSSVFESFNAISNKKLAFGQIQYYPFLIFFNKFFSFEIIRVALSWLFKSIF